ncbi:YifB family Mg chelatase-like AAA ATPase [Candidatus Shapirobacteria bacterium]|nr:YifB family Mg chelatase-like AAA ATPase [Candidatus Shapirobacteria bacterium]HQI13469.1 YifB family Mg chelatase-like AAA ATPase [Candidatus Woesebacteria bacterium]
MLTKIWSAANYGLEAVQIETEVNVAEKGFPGFTIVGLASKAVEEAKERVKTAIINCDMEFPTAKITVNLAPADLPKEGAYYDLPIAVGILASSDQINLPDDKEYYFGELSLDGSLRHSRGVFLLAILAKEKGVKKIFVPRLCANEAAVVEGIEVYPVNSLKDLIRHLRGDKLIEPLKYVESHELLDKSIIQFDFSEILGQESAKRALEIAAAGGHNVFLMGPPGSGKTMLSRALPGILPPLSEDESLEVTKIYSITGNIPSGGSMIRNRPFRSPHHTTSQVGLIGGGSNPRPGEISLAHRGVLFIDEFPELSRISLEALRQPIEDGYVSISRASGSVTFPCQFMLVAAANPCPCGYLGDEKKECKCNVHQVLNYQKKLSGPIMDRIDIHLNVPSVDVNKLMVKNVDNTSEKSEVIRERVIKAREIQKIRFKNAKGVYCNSDMKNKHLKEWAKLEESANLLLKNAVNKFSLSARTYFRLIKVSRTIADLAASDTIKEVHIAEALQYRVRTGE